MKNTCFFLTLVACLFGNQLTAIPPTPPVDWTTAPLPITPSSGVNVDVTVSGGPTPGDVVAAWSDIETYSPYYSIYHLGIWTTGTIPLNVTEGEPSVGVYDNIYTTRGPNPGNLVAAWSDSYSELPYFSLYDGSTWTTDAIPPGDSIGCYNDVVLAPGPNSGEVTATWTNLGSHAPYYSIYSGGSWTTGTIPLGGSTGSENNVFVSAGPTPGTLVATWTDYITLAPYYSIYSSGTWTTGTIPLGTSTAVSLDVVVAQGPNNGEVVAVWADDITKVPYASIYNAGTWTTTAIPLPLNSSSGCLSNVFVSSGPNAGGLTATWADTSTNLPYYAFYSNGTWGGATALPLDESVGVYRDVTVARTLSGYTMIAAWADTVSHSPPYFSSFVGTPPAPPAPFPPTNGLGKRVKDRFALLVEWYNELKWTASLSEDVVGYNIRRNGTLIATNVQSTSYVDHNRSKKGTDFYTITSTFEDGTESSIALEIKVKPL